MDDVSLPLLVGAIIPRIPLLAVCIVGLVAALKSRAIPASAAMVAAVGFLCLLAQATISIVYQLMLPSLRSAAESATSLSMKLGAFGLLQTILLAAGVAFVGIAVFLGRKNES